MGIFVKCAEALEKGIKCGHNAGIVEKSRNLVGGALNAVGNFIKPKQEDNTSGDQEPDNDK